MDDELSPPIPPRKGDLLFRADLPDWRSNGCLNPSWGDARVGYTEGYRRGARVLVQHVVENQRDQDYLVYPIIFLYRHHIELALKNLIMKAPFLVERSLSDSEKGHLKTHRLDLLWQDLKPMFVDICKVAGWNNLDSADVDGIDDYIRQLSGLDPYSYSFRYTHSKKGDPSLPQDVQVNLRNFAEMMERLADYLDALDAATDHLEEIKAEWQSENAQYLDYE